MEVQLRQIVYISTASKLDEAGVQHLLDTAQRINSMQGITGFLLYNGRNFLQLIEGAQADLLNLMTRLSRDPRHSGMVVLVDNAIDARSFPEWSMERLGWASDVDQRRADIAKLVGAKLSEETGRTVSAFASLN